jgi:hypothetical protein
MEMATVTATKTTLMPTMGHQKMQEGQRIWEVPLRQKTALSFQPSPSCRRRHCHRVEMLAALGMATAVTLTAATTTTMTTALAAAAAGVAKTTVVTAMVGAQTTIN